MECIITRVLCNGRTAEVGRTLKRMKCIGRADRRTELTDRLKLSLILQAAAPWSSITDLFLINNEGVASAVCFCTLEVKLKKNGHTDFLKRQNSVFSRYIVPFYNRIK